jgi:cell division protein FtsA
MMGVRLEADVHIITCGITSEQNLIKCVNRAGFHVNDLILQSLAAGRAVLNDQDKELGTILIDLGGGTTEVIVYSGGAPYSTTTIELGGDMVTSDISLVKGIAKDVAERVKKEAGCCWDPLLESDEPVVVEGIGTHPPVSIPRSQLLQIIRPRMEEIYGMVRDKLASHPAPRPLAGGIVLTGGGAQLSGAAELAQSIFNMPVRIGEPLATGGLEAEYRKPEYATAVGLVLEGDARERAASGPGQQTVEAGRPKEAPEGNGPLKRIKHWFGKEFF